MRKIYLKHGMMKISNRVLFLGLILACLVTACAKKTAPPVVPQPPSPAIADLKEFPQNLEVYAKEAGPDKRIIAPGAQDAMYSAFINTWFGPWEMRRTTISRREVSGVFGRARGYKNNSVPWSQPEWDIMKANARLSAFPSRAAPAITLRQTDLRELPTHEPRFSRPTPDPKADPFDNFQYSLLPAGMPLLVAHTSADGAWSYIECPIAGGWVDSNDLAVVDETFKANWRTGHYLALIKDKVVLPGTGRGGGDSTASIGTILPAARLGIKGEQNVLVPVREKNGRAGTAEITLPASAVTQMPLALTPRNVAAVGNVLMNQPYGWGGMLGLRDCSAMVRDLFAPFGIWLPRNSAAQARRGRVVRLAGMTPAQKAETILREGQPFLSLVGMAGHITLYVGRWKNKPALFHNVWGVRVIKNGNDNERHVIGRAVVTSIMPGIELENLYRPKTFVDRLRTLNTPAPK